VSRQSFLYLTQEQVVECGGADVVATVADVDRATRLLYEGEAIEATTATLFWDLSEEDRKKAIGYKGTKRVNCHAAFVNDDGERMVGVKNIPSNPENPVKGRGPRASGLLTMLDAESGYPIALMDCAVISCTRTGALGALGARYLRKSGINDVCLIGVGPINQAAMAALHHVCNDGADIGLVHVFDLTRERAEAYARRIETELGVRAQVAESAEAAVRAADIVMPATTLTVPEQAYIPYEWFRRGALYIDLSIWDAKYDLYEHADKFYANAAESIERHNLTPGCLVDAGILQPEQLLDLGGVIAGKVPGRDNDDQIIVYFARGMAIYDAICGHRVQKTAEAGSLGQDLVLWEHGHWG